ncbi:hypothetical protein ACODT3_29090 [Streptomyces sp. 4.24]|uniref:hypothetical protein n=1 Tax=Streptomyces tritrimontium TaxID=3406573 RepID=UPI003BB67474
MSEVAIFLIILLVTVVGWGVIFAVAHRQTYGRRGSAGHRSDSGGSDAGGDAGADGGGCGSGGGD